MRSGSTVTGDARPGSGKLYTFLIERENVIIEIDKTLYIMQK